MSFLRSLSALIVCLPSVTCAEMLTNPGFDHQADSWILQIQKPDGAAAPVGVITPQMDGTDGFLHLQRSAPGTSMFSLQIYQRVAITPGKRYLCRIKARSSSQAWINVILMRDEGDYAAATDPVYSALGSTWMDLLIPLAPKAGVQAPIRLNIALDDRSSDKSADISSVSLEAVE